MRMKEKGRIVLLCITVLFFLIFVSGSIFNFANSFKAEEKSALHYSEKSDIDYKVCLKRNTFYEEECLNKDMSYIASLINNISVNFNYDFAADLKSNYSYEYFVNGEVSVYEKNDNSKTLYKKTVPILKTQKSSVEGKSFNINKDIKIIYDDYNSLVRDFKNKYELVADSKLKLVMYVKTSVKNNKFDKNIVKNSKLEVDIPLSENTLNIAINHNDIDKKSTYTEPNNNKIKNLKAFIVALVCLVLTFIFLIFIIKLLTIYEKDKTEYQKLRDRLLKEYDYLIMNSLTLIEEGKYETYDVKDFKELVEIAERTGKVIMWTEDMKKEELVSWFSIIDNGKLYRRIIRESDFD